MFALLVLWFGGSCFAGAADDTGDLRKESGWKQSWRRWTGSSAPAPDYGLSLPDQATKQHRVAVLIHGFNSSPESAAPLLTAAQERGLACGAFRYPNDQGLADSARLLSAELQRQKRLDPRREFALVTHSMGGLVARAVVEDPDLDAGNVRRLVMVAPPNHGSILAHYAVGTDLWEHWLNRRAGSPWRRCRDAVTDGLGEAAADLRPGSPFLAKLNSRPRNASVRYTIVAGSGGRYAREEINWVRSYAASGLRRLRARRKAQSLERALDELAATLGEAGDGVVAINRTRLDGVDDTIVLPFDHLGVASAASREGDVAAQHLIADKLLAFIDGGRE